MKPRPGLVLVVTLVLALALAVGAIGLLLVGTQEVVIAATTERLAAARAAAEGAALETVARWSTRAQIDLPVDSTRRVPPRPDGWPLVGGVVVSVSRLAPELFLVRSTATTSAGHHGTVTSRVGLFVRVLDPARLLATVPGTVTADGPVTVTSGSIAGEDACDDSAAAPGVVGGPVFAPSGTVTGRPPVTGPVPSRPSLDPLASPVLDRLVTISAPPTATPGPSVTASACRVGPTSWGAIDPASPCHSALPVVHASGDLTMAGGVGRGVLVVDGNLRMEGPARFEGLVVVRGKTVLVGGAEVRGALRTSALDLKDGRVFRDGCALAAAASAPALDRGFRPPNRWWVPVF